MVDDELKMAQLIARAAREEGHAADVAHDGETALWMAKAAPYDAIVLDVMLPGVDGVEVLPRVCARDKVWTPVLLLTARDGVGDRVDGLDAGADDYLTKPFSLRRAARAAPRASRRRVPVERPTVLAVGRPSARPGRAPRPGAARPRSS